MKIQVQILQLLTETGKMMIDYILLYCAIARSGICPQCGRNWIGIFGPCLNCGYSGPLIPDE